MGGGVCHNGGWLPRGVDPPQSPDIHITATVHLQTIDGVDVWVLVGDNGITYSPVGGLDGAFQIDGQSVDIYGNFPNPPVSAPSGTVALTIIQIALS